MPSIAEQIQEFKHRAVTFGKAMAQLEADTADMTAEAQAAKQEGWPSSYWEHLGHRRMTLETRALMLRDEATALRILRDEIQKHYDNKESIDA